MRTSDRQNYLSPIKVGVYDRHRHSMLGIRSMVDCLGANTQANPPCNDIEVTASDTIWASFLDKISQDDLDIVLLPTRIEGSTTDAASLMKQFIDLFPKTKIVAYQSELVVGDIFRAKQAGSNYIISINTHAPHYYPGYIHQSIRECYIGKEFYGGQEYEEKLEWLELNWLTETEERVGKLACDLINHDIAKELKISVETVRGYAKTIHTKFGVTSRTGLIKFITDMKIF